jgi:hypothetical protein
MLSTLAPPVAYHAPEAFLLEQRWFAENQAIETSQHKHNLPALATMQINGAVVSGKCGVMVNNQPLPECIQWRSWGTQRKIQPNLTKRLNIDLTAKPLKQLNTYPVVSQPATKPYVLLSSPYDEAFSHFFFETLSKVFIFDDLTKYNFIVSDTIPNYQFNLLVDLGIPAEALLKKPATEDWLIPELIFCQPPGYNNLYIAPDILRAMRTKFIETFQSPTEQTYSKVYLDRNDDRYEMRRITNEDALKEIARDKGFEVVTLGKLSFKDKVNLYTSATHIIGQYGGGLQFGFMAQPKSKWLVLQSPHFMRPQIDLYRHYFGYEVLNLLGNELSDEELARHKLPTAMNNNRGLAFTPALFEQALAALGD